MIKAQDPENLNQHQQLPQDSFREDLGEERETEYYDEEEEEEQEDNADALTDDELPGKK